MVYPFHPVANIFPLIEGDEFKRLVADIKQHGLIVPIMLYGGQIIDGRNRYRACLEANVEPRFEEWNGTGDLVKFTVSLNLHRRHLDESQRSMVAGRVENMAQGRPSQEKDANLHLNSVTRTQAAELVNVSTRSVADASKVLDQGTAQLVKAVDDGLIPVSRAAYLVSLPPEQQRAVVDKVNEGIKPVAAIRAVRKEMLPEPSFPEGKFGVIYADPPWQYDFAETESRAIENQYPTLTIEEICARPVANKAADDCVLFLWVTSPKLEEAFSVIAAWGFSYRTCMVWVKDKIGMGYYARQQHELLLIAKRGNPPMPETGDRPSSVINAPRTDHSEKPVQFYEAIERMYPNVPKIELFQRKPREGWAGYGNEVAA